AQYVLRSSRMKTNYGDALSRHWIYVTLQVDSEMVPAIVTIEVRRIQGLPRVFLTEVRKPTSNELKEIGAEEDLPDSRFPSREAKQAIRHALQEAKNSPRQTTEELRRGILAHDGAALDSEYVVSHWRIAAAKDSASGPYISEKIIYCDRLISGADAFDIGLRTRHHLTQLSLLLSVFWAKHFYTMRSDHCWTIDSYEENGQLKLHNELRQLGYSPEPPGDKLSLIDSGPTRSIDRLDALTWVAPVSEPFRPPDDASSLYELFEQADLQIAQRFLESAKAYHTSHVIWPTTTTGAIAYLVVAAESLIEQELPQCPKCHQHRGVLQAVRNLVFRELPCLLENESAVKSLLN